VVLRRGVVTVRVTDEVEPLTGVVGQDDAIEALRADPGDLTVMYLDAADEVPPLHVAISPELDDEGALR